MSTLHQLPPDPPSIGRETAARRAPAGDRLALMMVGAGICVLPFLNPKGPLNTAPADVILGAAILVVAMWVGVTQMKVHAPYTIPVVGLAVTGLIAALMGPAPFAGVSAIIQEGFLLVWCAALVTLCRTPQALRVVLRTWLLSAAAWAAVVVLAVLVGQDRVPGGSGGEGARARLWFDHPNMAGNYFVMAFFVLVATRYPSKPFSRALVGTLLLIAILLTGSNSALLCLPIGIVIIGFLRTKERRGAVAAIGVGLSLVLGLGAAWVVVAEPIVASAKNSDLPLLRHSVGRSSKSADSRATLFESQYELFRDDGNLLGIGPSATRQVLEEERAERAKQAHNDYLASLVERGPFALVALLALMGSIVVRVASTQQLPPEWAAVVPNPAAFAAAVAGYAATAMTHEILHYRHLWTLLAVIAALHLATVNEQRRVHSIRQQNETARGREAVVRPLADAP